jgi:ribosome maturation factor RimP
MGATVLVKLYRPKNGQKEFVGTLNGYEDGNVIVTVGNDTVTFEKNEVALTRLYVEF